MRRLGQRRQRGGGPSPGRARPAPGTGPEAGWRAPSRPGTHRLHGEIHPEPRELPRKQAVEPNPPAVWRQRVLFPHLDQNARNPIKITRARPSSSEPCPSQGPRKCLMMAAEAPATRHGRFSPRGLASDHTPQLLCCVSPAPPEKPGTARLCPTCLPAAARSPRTASRALHRWLLS